MRKKIFSLIIAGVLTAGLLTGCSSNSEEKQNDSTTQSEQPTDETELEEDTNMDTPEEENLEEVSMEEADSSASEGKTLVVYFSATGNTEDVASAIAEATGGKLFELEPVEPYTSEDLDWTDDDSRVSKEHENPEQRDVELVSTTIDGWESVSVVYIGYPIWWGEAAWAVDSFVKANDFSGKIVVPFCTSSSSGLGQSGEMLAEMAGTGEWQEGMRFQSSASSEDVKAWVEELGL